MDGCVVDGNPEGGIHPVVASQPKVPCKRFIAVQGIEKFPEPVLLLPVLRVFCPVIGDELPDFPVEPVFLMILPAKVDNRISECLLVRDVIHPATNLKFIVAFPPETGDLCFRESQANQCIPSGSFRKFLPDFLFQAELAEFKPGMGAVIRYDQTEQEEYAGNFFQECDFPAGNSGPAGLSVCNLSIIRVWVPWPVHLTHCFPFFFASRNRT